MPDIDRDSEGTELRAGVDILSTHGLRKTFPGVVALDTVDFDVRAGEVHALLGANGEGKSTLIKLIAGLYSPDAGEITLFDRPVNFTSAADAMAAGVSVIYQDFALIPYLNVAENIFLGNEILGPFGLVDWTATHREARRLLDLVGCGFPTEVMVWELGTGQRQLVEVAKALRREARVLILDEPTASLSQGESARLFDLIRELKRKRVGIVYVSHRLDEIAGLVDRVTVLRDGRSMGTFAADDIDRSRGSAKGSAACRSASAISAGARAARTGPMKRSAILLPPARARTSQARAALSSRVTPAPRWRAAPSRVCPSASPLSAARRHQRAASAGSRSTPRA